MAETEMNELAIAGLASNSLELPDGLPYEEWLTIVKSLFKSHKRLQWAIGDALVYGQKNYNLSGSPNKNSYSAVAAATGFTVEHLWDIASVSRSVPCSVRRDDLAWSHHRAVASLPVERQEYWLTMAAAFDFSVTQLKYELYRYEESFQKRMRLLAGSEASLLLPPVLPELDKQPKPEPKPKPEPLPQNFKDLEKTTHLTGFEGKALKQFAAEKGINPDEAIRGLVVSGLHSFGILQKVVDSDSTFVNVEREVCEVEMVYLACLGEAWYGDSAKFTLNLPDDEVSYTNTDHARNSIGFSKPVAAKVERYIKTAALFLHQCPEFSAEDVRANLDSKLTISQAEFILAKARKVVEECPVDLNPENIPTPEPVS